MCPDCDITHKPERCGRPLSPAILKDYPRGHNGAHGASYYYAGLALDNLNGFACMYLGSGTDSIGEARRRCLRLAPARWERWSRDILQRLEDGTASSIGATVVEVLVDYVP